MTSNILGGTLSACSTNPLTGFYRDGCCTTGADDHGRHIICAIMTNAFLRLSKALGNDLTTPRPEFGFPGLKPGDRWCLCADRWREAEAHGFAPPIVPQATHEAAGAYLGRELLLKYAVDANENAIFEILPDA